MPLHLIRNSIVEVGVDVIVNAANERLRRGSGVCGAIFLAAGKKLDEECEKIGHCNVGDAIITKSYDLPVKAIIHTVGPVWNGGSRNEEKLLRSCYINSLKIAKKNEFSSIAFPLISSGIFGYPKKDAFNVAKKSILEFLNDNDIDVYLVLYSEGTLEKKVDVENYLNEGQDYVVEDSCQLRMTTCASIDKDIEKVFASAGETFSEMLFRLIDERKESDTNIYKRANIDRKHFSKMRNKDYVPSKNTVFSLAIALRLSLEETIEFLAKAGFSFSNRKFDLIVKYFFEKEIFDVHEINETLFAFDLSTL